MHLYFGMQSALKSHALHESLLHNKSLGSVHFDFFTSLKLCMFCRSKINENGILLIFLGLEKSWKNMKYGTNVDAPI